MEEALLLLILSASGVFGNQQPKASDIQVSVDCEDGNRFLLVSHAVQTLISKFPL